MTSNSMVMNNKEKTKLRERQRRSITTKIFHGLRKHGGYNLSPRSDINHVLRQLAMEAGWVVEPDGTTYRSPAAAANFKDSYVCPACGGAGKRSSTSTPSSSFLATGGGEFCSMMAPNSPRRSAVSDSMMPIGGGNAVALYGGGLHQTFAVTGQNVSTNTAVAAYHDHDHYPMEMAKASNQNTPIGSP